jgi:fucose permease
MTRDRRLTMGFTAFVLLGMPYAALGVAWPSIASDFGRALGDLGFVLVTTTVGYVGATLANGWMTHRLGTGRVMPIASGLIAIGITGFTIAPSLPALLAAGFCLGIGGGAVDAGINAYVAMNGSTRAMGWLHAVFGLGSTIGPLLATVLIAAGASWRIAFAVLAAAQAAITLGFVSIRSQWPEETPRTQAPPRLPRQFWPVMAFALIAFALYTGVEVAAGEWSYSLFTEGRGLEVTVAGYLVTGFWAALTVGRIAMGIAGDRITLRHLLVGSLVGTASASALLWWSPAPWVGAVGLILTGLFLAPIFPALVLVTSRILGRAYAPWAIGYQIAAAGVGAAAIPGIVGALVGGRGIGIAGPVIAVGASFLLVAGVSMLAMAHRQSPIDTRTPHTA